MYKSTYFIKIIENNTIEKLFLHGQWKNEPIDTPGERKVLRYLSNNQSKEYLKGFRIDADWSNMRQLSDYYSESEIIIPFKNNNQILGAVVKVYGD